MCWLRQSRHACGPAFAQGANPLRIALIEGLSGPFANAGEAVFRNLLWAAERVNQRGGVRIGNTARSIEIMRYDSEGNTEKALGLLRAATDGGIGIVAQGNSSAAAAALIDALDKHNQREPQRRALLLNYSAVDPALTNERCSPWHFRFDAHADMRLAALTEVLRADTALKKVYLLGQDYSFGQHVNRRARAMLAAKRPDIEIVGDELHPLGRIKDFLPYAAKIQASGAQAVLTGNWGNDLTLLVKAAREVSAGVKFYTFYGNALGVPAAIGEAGVGAVYAVAEWHPNVGGAASDAFYAAFSDALPSRATTTCTCACRRPSRCWPPRSSARAAPRRARCRVRSPARASMRSTSAASMRPRCARPTTSCSSRWSSA